MTKKLFLITLLFLSVKLFAGTPQLTNFRIENSQKSRVYFDSSEPITGSTYNGFTITDKSITGVTINPEATTGHYFTVSSDFTFWDNNTIAYSGGSNINIYNIDREYIANNIIEPTSSAIRYVSATATGSGNGTSEGSAWTFAQAVSNATSGMTVYVKAGNYGGGSYVFSRNGTVSNPIKFIGYRNTINDNPNINWSFPGNTSTDSSEMPLFENGSGDGLRIQSSYFILRNFQVDNYDVPFRINGPRKGVVLDNIIAMNASRGNYGILNDQDGSSKCRLLNSVSYNAGTALVRWYGTEHYIYNTKTIQPTGGVDYYIQIRGDNNIVRNCHIERNQDAGHSGHGISVKSVGNSTEHGLYENMNIIGIKLAIEARHDEVAFNVFRNITCEAGNVSMDNSGGIAVMNGSHDNIFDNIRVFDGDSGVRVIASSEKTDAPTAGYNNIFKNCTFARNKYGLFFYRDSYLNRQFYNNTFININIYGSTVRAINTGSLNLGTNYMINSNIVNNSGDPDIVNMNFNNINFYNSGNKPNGTSIISVDPQFVNPASGDFHLKPTSPVKDSGIDNNLVNYDADGVERISGKYSIGPHDDAIPVVGAVSSDLFICDGGNAILVASGGISYEWNTGETTATINVNPTSTTTYTVIISDGNNSDTHEVLVTVNTPPSVDLGADVTICDGEAITLTASGEGEFLWSTGEVGTSITVSPTDTTTYSVTASNSCSITATDDIIVTVNPSVAVDAGDDISICIGESTTLTAIGNGPFLWSTGETTQSIDVTPSDTTTFTVTSTVDSCSMTDEVVVTVNTLPTVSLDLDFTICEGETVTLTAVGVGEFLWSTGETTQSIEVTPTSTTTYSVTASNSCSVSASDDIVVTVNPSVAVNAGVDVSICSGENTTLTAIGNGPFLWSTGETTQSINVLPTNTTTYTVTSTIGSCSMSDEVKVIVNTPPTVDLGVDLSICEGETVTLTAVGVGEYLWSTGETTQSIEVTPTSTMTYTVIARNACASEATDDIVVTVNPNVTLDAGEDVSVCRGEKVTLVATGDGPFLWSTGATSASIEVTPTNTTTYTVTSSNGNCSKTDQVKVTVNTPPTVNAGSDVAICEGEQIMLRATGNGNFLWSTGETTSSIFVSPNSTTTYTVTASAGGCVSTATDNITVSVSERPSVVASDDVTIEMGTSVTLTATGVGTFEWSTGEIGSSITVSPNVTTSYTVKATTEGGCSQSDKVTVTVVDSSGSGVVNAYAGEDVSICSGKVIVLTASGGDSYLWSTGETDRSITVMPEETVIYSVKVFNGPNSATDHVTVFIDEKCGNNVEKEVVVFPNPTNGQQMLNIKMNGHNGESNISLFNLKGVMVYSDNINNEDDINSYTRQVNLSRFSNGIYLVRINNYESTITKKVIVSN